MTKEELEKYIDTPLCKELYDKFKIIYDKGYQDCKKEIKNYTSVTINDYQKALIEIYNEMNESEHAVCYLTSYDNDVILAAIKALGQEPQTDQEPCEDCISRTQAKSDYADWFGYGYQDNWFYRHLKNMPSVTLAEPKTDNDCISRQMAIDTIYDYEYKKDIRKALEELPSVKPQQKTGHWILDETDNSIICDKCGCRIWANDIFRGEAHYCPNCGSYNGGEE